MPFVWRPRHRIRLGLKRELTRSGRVGFVRGFTCSRKGLTPLETKPSALMPFNFFRSDARRSVEWGGWQPHSAERRYDGVETRHDLVSVVTAETD